jgi:hypothetical protein
VHDVNQGARRSGGRLPPVLRAHVPLPGAAGGHRRDG